jgi:hypothetical protein
MADRMTSGDRALAIAEANLGAFFRHRADVPVACRAPLIRSLSRLRGSDDPIVTFGQLPGACVTEFADACQVELCDGTEPPFRLVYPARSADAPDSISALRVSADQMLATPFRVASGIGYASYAGVVTHWWAGRKPSECDAVIADLMVRHLVALVDHERLMASVARAEDRAASLALEAISGRTISLAIGIVMHQRGLAADDAESLLRRSAEMSGSSLHQVAAIVVRAGSLASPAMNTRVMR